MKPQTAVFDKQRPVTKAEFWVVFRHRRGFRTVQVDEARAVIGANAPRYWEQKGYLVERENAAGELVYELTDSGKQHLLDGIGRFIKNHPDRKAGLPYLPRGMQ